MVKLPCENVGVMKGLTTTVIVVVEFAQELLIGVKV
jgi:hypothetical protein